MNLREFADQFALPSLTGGPLRKIRLWDDAYKVLGNETRTDPTVAAVLTQIVLLTPDFPRALNDRGLDPHDSQSREIMLVDRSMWGEYVLLVADDRVDDMDREALFLNRESTPHGPYRR